MFKITLITFLIFFSRRSVDAISCYSCDSGVELQCENPEKNDALQVACTQETLSSDVKKMYANDTALVRADDFICYKMKITIENKDGVLRGCTYAYGDHCEKNGAIIRELGGTVDYCGTCNTDLCNSSNGIHVHLFTSIVCFFVALITSELY